MLTETDISAFPESWLLEGKPVVSRLLVRRRVRGGGLSRKDSEADVQAATLDAIALEAASIALQAQRAAGASILVPSVDPNQTQLAAFVLASVIAIGLASEAHIEGVAIPGSDLGAYCVSLYFPLHSIAAAAEIGSDVNSLASFIVSQRQELAHDIFRAGLLLVTLTEAGECLGEACFPDGLLVGKLLQSLTSAILGAV